MLNKVIGYEPGMENPFLPGQEPYDMLHTYIEMFMIKNSSTLSTDDGTSLLDLRCHNMWFSLKLYPHGMEVDIKLGHYGIIVPEGILVQNAHAIHVPETISVNFKYKPFEVNVDWCLFVRASACYITFWRSSIERIMDFFQNSKSVTPQVALDAAAAIQMKFDEVSRQAQAQFVRSLKERPSFMIDVDISAPKVSLPTKFAPDCKNYTQLLLDLGHFSLRSSPESEGLSAEEKDLYLAFKMSATQISAFIVDGTFDWSKNHRFSNPNSSNLKDRNSFNGLYFPLLGEFAIVANIQQIWVPSVRHPTIRLSVRIPSISFNFSPGVYHRLMAVISSIQFQGNQSDTVLPWSISEKKGKFYFLSWEGIANRDSVWQPCFGVLAGPFLYILASPNSKVYKRRVSLYSKRVTDMCDAFESDDFVLALQNAKISHTKTPDYASDVILMFENVSEFESWKEFMNRAIQNSSVDKPYLIDDDEKNSSFNIQLNPMYSLSSSQLVYVKGILEEFRLTLCGVIHPCSSNLLLEKEVPILNLYTSNASLELAVLKNKDILVGGVLQTLDIKDEFSSIKGYSFQYLARSHSHHNQLSEKNTLDDDNSWQFGQKNKLDLMRSISKSKSLVMDDEESEYFFDADANFTSPEPSSPLNPSSQNTIFFDLSDNETDDYLKEDQVAHELITKIPPTFDEKLNLLPLENNVLVDVPSGHSTTFIKCQYIRRNEDSDDYSGIDSQLIFNLATLSFFCNRPTVLTLMDVISDINAEINVNQNESIQNSSEIERIEERPKRVGKDILGKGKLRTILKIEMHIDDMSVHLNKEDGNQLGFLTKEKINIDFMIYPSTFGLKADMGNLRICDSILGKDHDYGWMCQAKDSEAYSFINLEVYSYTEEESDYEGYDYSVKADLLQVQLIYLNRFIQEISEYFLGMSPRNPGQLIKLKQGKSELEKFFTQSDIQGASAIKLDLTLKNSSIIFPHSSHNHNFLRFELEELKLGNSIEWLCGSVDNNEAIHLEKIFTKLSGIHLNVGVNRMTGMDLIHLTSGLDVNVHRTLRDLWKKLPLYEISVQMSKLNTSLTDQEYQVITDCIAANFSEIPNLPPQIGDVYKSHPTSSTMLAHSNQGEIQIIPDGEIIFSQLKINVDIQEVHLNLYSGSQRETMLAEFQIHGLWIVYNMKSTGQNDVNASLFQFFIKDGRANIPAHLRYIVGSAENESMITNNGLIKPKANFSNNLHGKKKNKPSLTMLTVDYAYGTQFSEVSIRIQRPMVLVTLDFISSLVNFFSPTKNDESSDRSHSSLILKDGIYHQKPNSEVAISSLDPLIADYWDIDEYIYDGHGGSIRLTNEDGTNLCGQPSAPLIIVGHGKTLKFRNVIIKNGDFLDYSISLGNNSKYSTLANDYVTILPSMSSPQMQIEEKNAMIENHPSPSIGRMTFCVWAIGAELTFYDTTKWPNQILFTPENLIRVKTTAIGCYKMENENTDIEFFLKDTQIGSSTRTNIIDSFDTSFKFHQDSQSQTTDFQISDIVSNISFNILSLMFRIQKDFFNFFQISSANESVVCFQFDKIWADEDLQLAFWRPRAPSGFVVLGDCITTHDSPPSQTILAVKAGNGRVKKPVKFDKIWSSHNSSANSQCPIDKSQLCSVWQPIPPPGFVAMGCVAVIGDDLPHTSSVYCISLNLVTPAAFKDCVYPSLSGENAKSQTSFWRIENSVNSFVIKSNNSFSTSCVYDLRSNIMRKNLLSTSRPVPSTDIDINRTSSQSTNFHRSSSQSTNSYRPQFISRKISSLRRDIDHVVRFQRIWLSKGVGTATIISVWKPIAPPGFAILGDIVVQGYEPPSPYNCFAILDQEELVSKPITFTIQATISKKGTETVTFWNPVPPPDYVAMGVVAIRGSEPPNLDRVRCIRKNQVRQTSFHSSPLFFSKREKSVPEFSIWVVHDKMQTFFLSESSSPPKFIPYSLLNEDPKDQLPFKLHICCKLKHLSCTLFDDFGGLMMPLFDVTLKSVDGTCSGRDQLYDINVDFVCFASTFNDRHDAWEPLMEKWKGKLKVHSNQGESDTSQPLGTKLALQTEAIEVNLSSANINHLLVGYGNWIQLSQMEEKAQRKDYQTSFKLKSESWKSKSQNHYDAALQAVEPQKVIQHNKLGHDLFIRSVNFDGKEQILRLPSDERVTLSILPRRVFMDPSTSEVIQKVTQKYIALRIGQCMFSLKDDDVSMEFLCNIRLLDKYSSSSHLLPSTLPVTRTRSQASEKIKIGNKCINVITWNEIFVFQFIPEMDSQLEIAIKNSSTGSVLGHCFLDLKKMYSNKWKNVISRVLNSNTSISWNTLQEEWSRLSIDRKFEDRCDERLHGSDNDFQEFKLSTSHFFFVMDDQPAKQLMVNEHDSTGKLQVSLIENGDWVDVKSPYEGGAVPWIIGDEHIASETGFMDGTKYLTLRSLITVFNELDFPIEVSLSPQSIMHEDRKLNLKSRYSKGKNQLKESLNTDMKNDSQSFSGLDSLNVSCHRDHFVEEIFENQRYSPVFGWGSRLPGNLIPSDPKRWSDRTGKSSTQYFEEPPLPKNWVWKGGWKIDRLYNVDWNGWAYGSNFHSIVWPPTSPKVRSKGFFKFCRRRRWIRVREFIPGALGQQRFTVGVLQPGDSLPLPATCLSPNSPDYCIQIRPALRLHSSSMASEFDSVSQFDFEWGVMMEKPKSWIEIGRVPASDFCARDLRETSETVCCKCSERVLKGASGLEQAIWLRMESSSTSLGNFNMEDVKDWRISVFPPILIENLLPIYIRLEVWNEVQSNVCSREEKMLLSGKKFGITSLNPNKSIYFKCVLGEEWELQQNPILINNPNGELPDFAIFTNKKNQKKLRLSIQHEFESQNNSFHLIRLYTPCWIENIGCPPLYFFISHGDQEHTNNQKTQVQCMPSSTKDESPPSFSLSNVYAGNLRKNYSKQICYNKRMITMLTENKTDEESSDGCVHGSVFMLSQYDSKSMSLSVAIHSKYGRKFGPSVMLSSLESPMDDDCRIESYTKDGTCLHLFASVEFAPIGPAGLIKVIKIKPFVTFSNRLGKKIYLKNEDLDDWRELLPDDNSVYIPFQKSQSPHLIQFKVEGTKWSCPLPIWQKGKICVVLRDEFNNSRHFVQFEVRNNNYSSCFLVYFRCAGTKFPLKIENRSSQTLKFCQPNLEEKIWDIAFPFSSTPFAKEDFYGSNSILILADKEDDDSSLLVDLGQSEYRSSLHVQSQSSSSTEELSVVLTMNGGNRVLHVYSEPPLNLSIQCGYLQPPFEPLGARFFACTPVDGINKREMNRSRNTNPDSKSEYNLSIEKICISIIDYHPQELLYASIIGIHVTHSIHDYQSSLRLIVKDIQIDNQLPLSPLPVLLSPERETNFEHALKISLSNIHHPNYPKEEYPFIELSVTPQPWIINIHEPIIWRLLEMYNRIHLDRVFIGSGSSTVQVNTEVIINALDISAAHFKLTVESESNLRPRQLVGNWGPIITTLGNTKRMAIHFAATSRENMTMSKNQITSRIIRRVTNDLIHQPLNLILGLDYLGIVHTVLTNLSEGAAQLAMDKSFVKIRNKQDFTKKVENLREGLFLGSEAMVRGMAWGIAGTVAHPIVETRRLGPIGVPLGVSKAVLGLVLHPISGIIDCFAHTLEGADATATSAVRVLKSESRVFPVRLPRVIGLDGIVHSYDADAARGQAILRLAESGVNLGKFDIILEHARFFFTDIYHKHFRILKRKIFMITSRRIMILRPSRIHLKLNKKLDEIEYPFTVVWDVPWENILYLERSQLQDQKIMVHVRTLRKKQPFYVFNCESPSQNEEILQETISSLRIFAPQWEKIELEYMHKPNKARENFREELLASSRSNKFMPSASLKHSSQASSYRQVLDECDANPTPLLLRDPSTSTSNTMDIPGLDFGDVHLNNTRFERVWTSECNNHDLHLCFSSILQSEKHERVITAWKPIPPPGYVSVGDVLVIGREPPESARVYLDRENGDFALPVDFKLIWRNLDCDIQEPISVWFPVPPPGYVSLGCIVINDYVRPLNPPAARYGVMCVSATLTKPVQVASRLLWQSRKDSLSPWFCTFYSVDNPSRTFLALRSNTGDLENEDDLKGWDVDLPHHDLLLSSSLRSLTPLHATSFTIH